MSVMRKHVSPTNQKLWYNSWHQVLVVNQFIEGNADEISSEISSFILKE